MSKMRMYKAPELLKKAVTVFKCKTDTLIRTKTLVLGSLRRKVAMVQKEARLEYSDKALVLSKAADQGHGGVIGLSEVVVSVEDDHGYPDSTHSLFNDDNCYNGYGDDEGNHDHGVLDVLDEPSVIDVIRSNRESEVGSPRSETGAHFLFPRTEAVMAVAWSSNSSITLQMMGTSKSSTKDSNHLSPPTSTLGSSLYRLRIKPQIQSLEQNPPHPTAMADWTSLPSDIITRVADGLLATDDIDYYIDLRAVCHSWRSSTADPKTSGNPRFQPRQWAMLDEVYQSDERLFVNTATGRFVRRDLSLLRRSYFVVAGADGGSIVLAERASPHAARVLNPFTGSLVRFVAPVPTEERDFVAHVISSSPPTLVLRCDESGTMIYWVYPDSESFFTYKEKHYHCSSLVKQALVGGIYAAAREPGLFPTRLSAGEMLIVFKLKHRFEVFKIDPASCKRSARTCEGYRQPPPLRGGLQLFPSVEANCIYYVIDEPLYICIYSLKDEKLVVAGGAIDSFNPHTLSPYTFELRGSELKWEKMFTQLSGMDKELFARLTEELSAYDCESDDDY
nr:unnamed protein product [Digitaria exilis]